MANVETRFANIGFLFGGPAVFNRQVQEFNVQQDIIVHCISSSVQYNATSVAGWCTDVLISGGFGIGSVAAQMPFTSSDSIHSYFLSLTSLAAGGTIQSTRDSMSTTLNGFVVRASKSFQVVGNPIGTGPFLGTAVTSGVFTIGYNTLAEWTARRQTSYFPQYPVA